MRVGRDIVRDEREVEGVREVVEWDEREERVLKKNERNGRDVERVWRRLRG